jgi:hypothetical protein
MNDLTKKNSSKEKVYCAFSHKGHIILNESKITFSKELEKIPNGEKLEIVEYVKNGWCTIQGKTAIGYVNSEDIVENENLPYKSYLGKSYTKEEWEPYEKELLRKERKIEQEKLNAIKNKELDEKFMLFILVVLVIISIALVYTQT